jgi:arylsulfatase A-like enzyme
MISRRHFIQGIATGAALVTVQARAAAADETKPNIIFIIADDVGYGDVGCFGAAHVKTPNIDRIAREGIRCTDAHSTAAVCTPTRYSIMTGEYAWRNPLGDHILSGVAPLSIRPGTKTTPSLLREAGYATGLVGKWHLGLGTPEKPVDYNTEITSGPRDVGFDYAFFLSATGDRVPCVYIEDRKVVGLDPSDPIRVSFGEKVGDDPTGEDHPELLKIKADPSHSKTIVNGVSRIGYMSGGNAARWNDEDMADTFTRKAVSFVERQTSSKPFFLYFAPHDIHEPMVPHPRFKGTSECGSRGDVIQELDWSVGEILAALDRQGFSENTLVVFTSDNGGALKDTYDDGTNALHGLQSPNGKLRGTKGTVYEGGHRVPFVARWPKQIASGLTSDALIAHIDMLATFCAAAGDELPEPAGLDSLNVLPVLMGNPTLKPIRDHLVIQNNGAGQLGLRQGPWKFIPPRTSESQTEAGIPKGELYNLADDLTESKNLAKENPEKLLELSTLLTSIRERPRSGP